jgi:hypothetical protein
MTQRAADQVVRFVFAVTQHAQAERRAERLAVHELALELFRRRVAIGLVGRVQRVAEAGVQGFVECDRDVSGAFAFEDVQQKAREALHGIGRPAIRILEFVGHRVPGAEDVDAGVDQIERRWLAL